MLRISLAAARVNAGLTQKQVAESLKVSNNTIVNWENGISVPNGEKIDAICELYRIPYDNLIFFKKNNA